MTDAAPASLAGAAWLTARPVARIFAALAGGGHGTRIIGGAVRNALMGVPVREVDFGTTARPDEIATLATQAGLKSVPTGVEHGTVTVVSEGTGYQVTTLREDIETDGRHAVVRFGRDWRADAMRRDFTVNALSVDADGTLHDPLGGYADIVARRIRFIGDAERRIAEDRLRILRFFRFTAEYGADVVDRDGLGAAIRARDGLRELSGERIGNEMRRLVVAAHAAETAALMQESGLLTIVLAGVGYLAAFARLSAFEKAAGIAPDLAVRLAALACRIPEDALRITERLRLSNSERDGIVAVLAACRDMRMLPDRRTARRLAYSHKEAFAGGARLAFAWGTAGDEAGWRNLQSLSAPSRFPLGGKDIVEGGRIGRGPEVGALLRSLETWWIDEDFQPDEAALRARLQQMIAAAQ